MLAFNVLRWGFITLFLFSIFFFHFFLLPEKFSNQAFLSSLALTLPLVVYLLIRKAPNGNEHKSLGFYTNASSLMIFILFFLVIVALSMTSSAEMQITRNVTREEGLLIKLINLHLILIFFACIYKFSNNTRESSKGTLLLLLCFGLSLYVSILEGRRTAILIPIILWALFSISTSKKKGINFFQILFFSILFIFFFMLVTYIRNSNVEGIELLFTAIVSRFLNPGHMILEVFSQINFNFDPQTISNSFSRLGYTLGLNDYQGSTNLFGRYYGFLSNNNFSVGINPGMIVESYLSFGYFYFFFCILIFEVSFLLMSLYKKLLFQSDIFVAILILHGLQMEIPYVVGLIFKLALAGLACLLLSYIIPSKIDRSIKTQ